MLRSVDRHAFTCMDTGNGRADQDRRTSRLSGLERYDRGTRRGCRGAVRSTYLDRVHVRRPGGNAAGAGFRAAMRQRESTPTDTVAVDRVQYHAKIALRQCSFPMTDIDTKSRDAFTQAVRSQRRSSANEGRFPVLRMPMR